MLYNYDIYNKYIKWNRSLFQNQNKFLPGALAFPWIIAVRLW